MNSFLLNKFTSILLIFLFVVSFSFLFFPVRANDISVKVLVGPASDDEIPLSITSISLIEDEPKPSGKLFLLIQGENFLPGTKVFVNGILGFTTYVSSTQLNVLTDILLIGNYIFTVVNPDGETVEKDFNYSISFITLAETGELLSIYEKQISAIAENVQVQTVIATGMGTGVAFASSLEYLKLLFIPYRKRKKYWGLVFEKSSMTPVAFTLISLFDNKTKKLITTAVSDMEGRYSIITDPGEYYLTITHSDYVFNSTIKDSNIYHGQVFSISQDQNLNYNIILERKDETRFSFKIRTKLIFNKILKIIEKLYLIILLCLFGVNVIFYLASKDFIYLILIIYHFFLIAFYFIMKYRYPRQWGRVLNHFNKNGISNAIVKIYNETDGSMIDNKIADRQGRFQLLLPKGKYQFIIQATGFNFPSKNDTTFQDEGGKLWINSKEHKKYDIFLDPIDKNAVPVQKFGII